MHVVPRGLRGGIQSLIKEIVLRSAHENVLCTWHTRGPLNDELESAGYRTIDLSGLSFPAVIRQIETAVSANQFDIVVNHGHEGKQAIIFAKCRFGDCKVIQYLHSCYEEEFLRHRWLKPVLNSYTKRAYAKADATIAISNYVLANQRYAFGTINNPAVIYNGIDCGRFEAVANLNRSMSRPIKVLYLGRLSKVKGVQTLIEACALMERENHPVQLTIAGWGDYKTTLEDYANSLGLQVQFAGEATNAADYFKRADVFVHSALWAEGFGITIVEAMASGCICIASDTGGIPEIIQDGETGFLSPRGDSQALADNLMRVQEMDDGEVVAMRNRANRRAKQFSISRYISSYDALVSRLARQ